MAASDGKATVLGIVDHGSRRALCLQVLADKCCWTLLGHLCLAVARHGKPRAVRTDNEAMFTSRRWRHALGLAGIGHQRSRPRCPWENGRIERFFGTLKQALRAVPAGTVAALQARLAEFVAFYDQARPHQGLGGLTPAEAWRGVTKRDLRRCCGQGRWVSALNGSLVGYQRRS